MSTAIKFENISKQYRLGLVSTRTLSHDLNRWWQINIKGKEDPYLKIGEVNDRAHKGESEYVWALKDIDFEVKQGDVLGIIGKNGAGKSTLLKILSKVTAPTTGTIKARGRIASLLEVGTGFHPEMTGRENIYMNGAILGMTKAEINRKLDEIIAFAGVERYIDTPVKRYSSGMMVRLGFAIAAHLDPEILVVDEVLAVGDAEFQKKAIGKMQDVSKGEGRTVLFVSHNMSAIQTLCNSCVLLSNGKLVASGSTGEIVNIYLKEASDNVKFLRAPIINQLASIVQGVISENHQDVVVDLVIEAKEKCQLSLDVRLSDVIGVPFAFGSLGSLNESTLLSLNVGQNAVSFSINTSKFAVGKYLVSLDLTVPDKSYVDRIENCLIFEVIRKPDNTKRRVLNQNWGYGSLEIDLINS